MPGTELKEKGLVLSKGKDIIVEPSLTLYWVGDALVASFPPAWPSEDDTGPCIEVFALEGAGRRHELERMVRVLFCTMDAMGVYNSKHERCNIRIEVEDRDSDPDQEDGTWP